MRARLIDNARTLTGWVTDGPGRWVCGGGGVPNDGCRGHVRIALRAAAGLGAHGAPTLGQVRTSLAQIAGDTYNNSGRIGLM